MNKSYTKRMDKLLKYRYRISFNYRNSLIVCKNLMNYLHTNNKTNLKNNNSNSSSSSNKSKAFKISHPLHHFLPQAHQ